MRLGKTESAVLCALLILTVNRRETPSLSTSKWNWSPVR